MSSGHDRSEGITNSERYLNRVARNTFLSLWSYPNLFGESGSELCDLLVVFDNHILIFSDKDCSFPNTGNIDVDWSRWFKKAVLKSAEQIWGAERWLRRNPSSLYLDAACKHKFPFALPNLKQAIFHRVAVAHGASARCRELYGGSGSLMIHTDIVGEAHFASSTEGGIPFAVGKIASDKGFVHVIDDATMSIVLETLDTVTDFVDYLSAKEKLVEDGCELVIPGEEDLLAYYLMQHDKNNKHYILNPNDQYDVFLLEEGLWEKFQKSDQRKAQIDANQISYAWDSIIEKTIGHAEAGTQYFTTAHSLSDHELLLRWLARESRFHRRALAEALINLVWKYPPNFKAVRVVPAAYRDDLYYVFLVVPYPTGVPYAEYREVRREYLYRYCLVARLKWSHIRHIIGIATESHNAETRSEDVLYADLSEWDMELEQEAREAQSELGLLTNVKIYHKKYHEFPIEISEEERVHIKGNARNLPCPCGSGTKYKKCCGKSDRQ